jgi:hypothetical protein
VKGSEAFGAWEVSQETRFQGLWRPAQVCVLVAYCALRGGP